MSPLLFALAIEPLHNLLRSEAIKGVPLPAPLTEAGNRTKPEALKAALFADDITLFPLDEQDANHMVRVINKFGWASGSKLNAGKTLVLLTKFRGQTKFAGLGVLQPGDKVKSLGMTYGPHLPQEAQWASVLKKMRERTVQWGRRKGLSLLGRVAVANSLITSTACYLAALTAPTEAQLKEMDYLVWAAVWGKTPATGKGAKRGGWMAELALESPVREGGVGLLLPSAVIRSRQVALVNRALLHQRATWTRFLQDRLRAWGGTWARGWDAMAGPIPARVQTGSHWAAAITVWQAQGWQVRPPESPWAAQSSPLWVNPALPGLQALRSKAGAASLAQAGILQVADLWDVGQRRWREDREVLRPVRAGAKRVNAAAVLAEVRAQVREWLGGRENALLLDAPPRPAFGSWWWDEVKAVGGLVRETRACVHACCGRDHPWDSPSDLCFQGFDVEVEGWTWGQWQRYADPETEVPRCPGTMIRVCGYDGSPLPLVPPAKPGYPARSTAPEARSGIHPVAWWCGPPERPLSIWRPARDFRRQQWRQRREAKQIFPPTAAWARWGGVEGEAVRHHFVTTARIRGLPHKAKEVILRLFWRKTVLPDMENPRLCPLCKVNRVGEGDEHTFMTCPTASALWSRSEQELLRAGVEVNTRCRAVLVGDVRDISTPRGVSGAKLWQTVWAGVIWSMWRAYNAARHGEKVSLVIMWHWAKAVWKDVSRVRLAEERTTERDTEKVTERQAYNDLWMLLLSDNKQATAVTGRRGGQRRWSEAEADDPPA